MKIRIKSFIGLILCITIVFACLFSTGCGKGNENNGTNAYFYSDYEKGKYANASESFALKNSGQLWDPDTQWTNFGVTYASWLANLDKWASGEYTYLRFELGGGRINANASIFILQATITSNA